MKHWIALTIAGGMIITASVASGQQTVDASASEREEPPAFLDRRHFVGSSLFVLLNFAPDAGDFYQLDYGYWLTPEDAVVLEVVTWKYHAPLGIPYGSSGESYPGYVRAYGLGVNYKRVLWGSAYLSVQATPFLQHFVSARSGDSQDGFQLFLQLRLGYHLDLFKGRVFVEPSVACNTWPITTNVPSSFAELDRKWPDYFLFEPGLHFGVTF